ncbi:MAG: hypothetical protein K2G55_10880, partial [Lachnospiraceae bacterium]|nr:hypothetical protein [Lachnospiraceae bacterium]
LYRDVNRAEAAARNFLVYEKEIESCYVCGHLPYLLHFLLVGQDQKAEELMLDYIHKISRKSICGVISTVRGRSRIPCI